MTTMTKEPWEKEFDGAFNLDNYRDPYVVHERVKDFIRRKIAEAKAEAFRELAGEIEVGKYAHGTGQFTAFLSEVESELKDYLLSRAQEEEKK